MEPGPPQMIPKAMEEGAGWLIPPACREEVLGDLHERYRNPVQYMFEVAVVIPCVVFSRIRRTTDAVLALVEITSMYTMLVMAAWWLERDLLLEQWGYLRLAIPPLIVLLATILADAYSNPRRRAPFKPLIGPALGLALATGAEVSARILPPALFAAGLGMGAIVVLSLRLMFPHVADRSQTAKLPAFWQKLEFSQPVWFPVALLVVMLLYSLLRR